MRRTTTTLLALSAVAAAGSTKTYDALALQENIIADGIVCPGTNQQVVLAENETAYLECNNRIMAMAVTGSKEELEKLLNARDKTGPRATAVLHAAKRSPLSKHRVKN